jgi:hypothetical protein
MTHSSALLVVALLVTDESPARDGPALPFLQESKVVASDSQAAASFAFSLAVSGDTAVIGAYLDDTPGGVDAGSAYVFVRSGTTWTEQQKLLASDGAAFDQFGRSVSISGDTIVVGALQDDNPGGADAGAAYVFVRAGTTWSQQQKITAPDGAADDQFGFLVSVSGDTLAAGSHLDDTPAGVDAGSAYVFTRSGTIWSLQQKLTPPDGLADDRFGFPVALSGDTLVAGSYRNDTAGGVDAGSAYVFVRAGSTWALQQKITAPDGAADDQFGRWVAVSGDTAVVGAILDDNANGPDAGSAYVFVRAGTTWSLQQKLTAPDGGALDQFGRSVAVSGDTAVIGAYLDDHASGLDAGSAYVFVRGGATWTPQWKLLAADGAASDLFGRAVSSSGDTVVAGAEWSNTPAGSDAGSAYVFRPAAASAYFALTPCRIADTRTGGPALGANSTRTFAVAGGCQVPADARAVAAILTAVSPGDLGNLRLFPTGQPAPLSSTLNFAAGLTRANNAIVPLGASGQIDVRCDMVPGSTASTHFVLDVFGYFR